MGPAGFGPDTASSLPEVQSWFTPGKTLAVPNTGELKLTITGGWSDHVPVGGHASLDPGVNEIRLVSPLLLKTIRLQAIWRTKAPAATIPMKLSGSMCLARDAFFYPQLR